MGTSAAAMTARVMGWFGQRTPTVSNPPGRAQRHDGLPGQNHRERPRPEFFCQRIRLRRDIFAVPRKPRTVGHMDDERIILRTALGQKNAQHRIFVQRVRAEAIDRLRRDRQQPAVPDDLCGGLDILLCGVFEINCFQVDSFLFLRFTFGLCRTRLHLYVLSQQKQRFAHNLADGGVGKDDFVQMLHGEFGMHHHGCAVDDL